MHSVLPPPQPSDSPGGEDSHRKLPETSNTGQPQAVVCPQSFTLNTVGQATEKISSLTEEKSVLEEEQGKLLSTNVEMAIETKKLLLLQKGWTRERQELMAANQEFVEEVERYLKYNLFIYQARV